MRRLLVTAVCAVLTATGLSAGLTTGPADAATTPATWDHGAGGQRYVAFGDSFVAGPGITPQRAGGCSRSARNFPSLVATALDVRAFTDASCSGATTADYWGAQDTAGGAVPPQLDALGSDTTLVTLGSMGGNDVGLVGLAYGCVTGECTGTVGDANYQAVDALAPVFRKVIADVRARAPRALIVAVGYGTYLPATSCPALTALGFTTPEAGYIQGLIDHLSDTIEAVAAEEGIAFADMRTVPHAVDHTPCADPDEQYIRALMTYDDGAPLHPSSLGMAKMADVVERTVRDARLAPADRIAAAAASVRLAASCRHARTSPQVRLRVAGGRGLVRKAVLRVGQRRVAADRTAPFRVTTRARPLTRGKAARGKVTATVTLRYEDLRRTRVVRAKRPACLR